MILDYIDTMNRWGKERKPFIFIIDYESLEPQVFPLEEASNNGIYFSLGNYNNIDFQDIVKRRFTFDKFPVSYSTFKESFDRVIAEIRLGNSFLTNLTFPTQIITDLTLREIFSWSEAPYKLLYKDSFAVFSPELFVKIRNGKISSYPMKGTIDASEPDA